MQRSGQPPRSDREKWGLLALVAIGFALRLHRLGAESLWYDETVSVQLALKSVAALIAHTAGDIHPPGYYLLLQIWFRLVGTHPGLEFLSAFPSLIFGLLLIPLGVVLSSRVYRGGKTCLLTALLLAVHPYHLWYAQEVRMYTLGAFLGMLSLLAAWWIGVEGESKARWWLFYAVAGVAGLYSLYYLAFLLLTLGMWLAFRLAQESRRRSLIHWLIAHAAMLVLYAPWLPILWRQVTEPPVPPWRNFIPPARMLVETVGALVAGQSFPSQWQFFPVALGLILSSLGIRSLTRRLALPLALHTWGPFLLIALIALATPLYHIRYIFTFATPFTIIVAGGIVSLRRRWISVPTSVVLILLSVVSLRTFWLQPEQRPDDHRAAVGFLAERWRPSDVILVNAGYAYTALLTYWPGDFAWRGRLTDDGWPEAADGSLPVLLQTGTVDGPPSLGWGSPLSDFYSMPLVETEALMARLFDLAPRVWTYRIYDTVTDPDGMLREWLEEHGQSFADQHFPGEANLRVQGWLTQPDLASRTPAGAEAVGATLGDSVTLVAMERPDVVTGGQPLDVTLYWRLERKTSQTIATSLRLTSPNGAVWAQEDEWPLGPLALSPTWPIGRVVRQPVRLLVPEGTPAGPYELHLTLYEAETGQPLLPDEGPGAVPGVGLRLGTVTVDPAAPRACRSWPDGVARFGSLQLESAEVIDVTYRAGRSVPVALLWRACADLSDSMENLTPILRLRNAQGQVVAEMQMGLRQDQNWGVGQGLGKRFTVLLPGYLATGGYRLSLGVIMEEDGRWLPAQRVWPWQRGTEVTLASLQVEGRAIETATSPLQVKSGAMVGEAVELVGYDLDTSQVQDSKILTITFTWRFLQPVEGDYKVFAHLLDAAGARFGQQDKMPGEDGIPTGGRVANEVVSDPYHIVVSPDAPPGEYRIAVGFYDEATGQRLPTFDIQGNPLGDSISLGLFSLP